MTETYTTAREAFTSREDRLRQRSPSMDHFRANDQQLENAFSQVYAFQILAQEPAQLDDVEMDEQILETNMSD